VSIRFTCPNGDCRRTIRVSRDLKGKRIRCPSCGVTLFVPRRSGTTGLLDAGDGLVGRRIAHYEVLELIGRGGTATVYRARNLGLDRIVALKVLPYSVFDARPGLEDRSKREARLCASIEHPNVLPVFFAGRVATGPNQEIYVIEMQYADGGTARDLLRNGKPINPTRATEIIRDAAAGLGAAHARNLVHGDVKPGNILLMKDGSVKVGDFGLARLQFVQDDLFAPGYVVGTPNYMSPEHALGRRYDQRSDIYSLGVTYFELVTGRKPFAEDTTLAMIRKHLRRPLPSPCDINPDCPQAVCNIIMKMTAKNPANRYQNCDELIRDLCDVLEDREVLAPPPTEKAAPLDISDEKIFESIAAFTLSTRGTSHLIEVELLEKAEKLGVPRETAEQILARLLPEYEQHAIETAIDSRPPAPSALRLRAPVIIRRFRAAGRWLVRIAVLSALGFGALYGAHVAYSRISSARQERVRQAEKAEKQQTLAALLQNAESLERRGNWAAAAKAYQRALALGAPKTVEPRIPPLQLAAKAESLLSQRKWAEAAKLYRQALQGLADTRIARQRLEFLEAAQKYEDLLARAAEAEKNEQWPEAEEAYTEAVRIAAHLQIRTDARARRDALRRKIAAEEKWLKDIRRLLAVCKKRLDAYAVVAVCSAVIADAHSQAARDEISKELAEAKRLIKMNPERYKPLRAKEARVFYRVNLKDGTTLEAPTIHEKPNGVSIKVSKLGREMTRFITSKDVVSVEKVVIKPEDTNRLEPERLFKEAVKLSTSPNRLRTLSIAGQLQINFPDSPLLKDEALQRKLSAAILGSSNGVTLVELVRGIVRLAQTMCSSCLGSGRIPCPDCAGTGKITRRCPKCSGTGRAGMCKYCRGSGLLQVTCPFCKGKKFRKCPHCNGAGCPICQFRGKFTCMACAGTGKVPATAKCSYCNGTGKDAKGGKCPKCKGRGKPICTKCQGTGRGICPECHGEGQITVKCTRCDADHTVKCPRCGGTGKKR